MSSTYNLVADFAMTAYIAPHVVLRFAFFYLLAIQIFSKPRQSTFAAITLAGLGHAFDTSILDWRVAFIVALDMAAVLGVLVCFLVSSTDTSSSSCSQCRLTQLPSGVTIHSPAYDQT